MFENLETIHLGRPAGYGDEYEAEAASSSSNSIKVILLSLLGLSLFFIPSGRFNDIAPKYSFSIQENSKAVPMEEITYDFTGVKSAFAPKSLNLNYLNEITKEDFAKLIGPWIPKSIRANALRPLRYTLVMAERYKLDPFWILSIMWTESHFRPTSLSHKGAQGLMQIMPATGEELKAKLKKDKSEKIYRSYLNIELGSYYLNYLKKRFRGNHKLATVAYNMGPNWVSRRLKLSRPVGVINQYLNKVRKNYALLTQGYRRNFQRTTYDNIPNLVALASASKTSLASTIFLEIRKEFLPYISPYENYVISNPKGKYYIWRAHGPTSFKLALK